MGVSRTMLSELCAIAAMPGLEEMAECVAPYIGNHMDPLQFVIFNAAQWAVGSRVELSSMIVNDGVWAMMEASALRVGRTLTVRGRVPSEHQFRRARLAADELGVDLGAVMAAAFVPAMRDLVLSTGLLPDVAMVAHRPARGNVVYGDGTTFKPYSGVTRDAAGNLTGSRATNPARARVSEHYYGKLKDPDTDPGYPGVPAALVGIHGGRELLRCVLAVGLYFDRDETNCSLGLFRDVHRVYGSRVHGAVYDGLFHGREIRELMRMGIIPIVNPKNAAKDSTDAIDVDSDTGVLLGGRGRPVNRPRLDFVGTADHIVNGERCVHELISIGGVLVTPDEHQWTATADSALVPNIGNRFEPDGGYMRCFGMYLVPCRHGNFTHHIDLTGPRVGNKWSTGLMAEVLRPIDATSEAINALRGYRSDVEGTFATLKGQCYKKGRARSLELDHFLQDLVGAGMWINSTAWDVYAAQHTDNAKAIYKRSCITAANKDPASAVGGQTRCRFRVCELG